MKKILAWAAGTLVLVAVLSEAAYSRATAAPALRNGEDCVVLVLGYPTQANGSPHPVQRFRVEAGVAVYQENKCERIVFSGNAVRNKHVEAESMAEIARTLGVVEEAIVIEPIARTTWENVGCSAPHLESVERVLLVSDSLHARRARRYACRQSSDLCPKIFAVGANPPASLLLWKMAAAANELRIRIRDFLVYERAPSVNAPVCRSE